MLSTGTILLVIYHRYYSVHGIITCIQEFEFAYGKGWGWKLGLGLVPNITSSWYNNSLV